MNPIDQAKELMELHGNTSPRWALGKINNYRVESLIDEVGGYPLAEDDSAYCIANCWSGASAPRMHVAIRNAAFIVAAHNAVPSLCQTILDQEKEIDTLTTKQKKLMTDEFAARKKYEDYLANISD